MPKDTLKEIWKPFKEGFMEATNLWLSCARWVFSWEVFPFILLTATITEMIVDSEKMSWLALFLLWWFCGVVSMLWTAYLVNVYIKVGHIFDSIFFGMILGVMGVISPISELVVKHQKFFNFKIYERKK